MKPTVSVNVLSGKHLGPHYSNIRDIIICMWSMKVGNGTKWMSNKIIQKYEYQMANLSTGFDWVQWHITHNWHAWETCIAIWCMMVSNG